jgi:uncharacterized protein (DUF2236 family)
MPHRTFLNQILQLDPQRDQPMVEHERLANFYYWREIGLRMNIQSLPDDYGAFERYNVEYERRRFRYSAESRRVTGAVRDLFLSWFLPRPFLRLGEPAIYALLDEPLLEAFGFPRPSPGLRRTVEGALRMRARLIRLLPERRRSYWRTTLERPTYPGGYRVEQLGPQT